MTSRIAVVTAACTNSSILASEWSSRTISAATVAGVHSATTSGAALGGAVGLLAGPSFKSTVHGAHRPALVGPFPPHLRHRVRSLPFACVMTRLPFLRPAADDNGRSNDALGRLSSEPTGPETVRAIALAAAIDGIPMPALAGQDLPFSVLRLRHDRTS